ncbi:MAG: NAD(P)H-dependent oxidoreductase [Alcanivoracaceae bacterium]|nr:NAD(P)H-dependent oxidoreductase [Alcanivoracaceae bacterium]
MATLLQVKSSIFGDNGNSSQLANDFIRAWQQANPNGRVVVRDVTAEPVPHLTAEHAGAFFTPEADRTEAQREIIAYSDKLVSEVRDADVIVLGVPMYNFAVPSQLKSWMDQIARAGVTFKYTETGPVGLIDNKPALVFATRGGLYAETPNDNQAPYLKQFLGFIGIKDVTFIYAEGVNMGDEKKQAALADAAKQGETQLKGILEKVVIAA